MKERTEYELMREMKTIKKERWKEDRRIIIKEGIFFKPNIKNPWIRTLYATHLCCVKTKGQRIEKKKSGKYSEISINFMFSIELYKSLTEFSWM